jgi:hypothetical protein
MPPALNASVAAKSGWFPTATFLPGVSAGFRPAWLTEPAQTGRGGRTEVLDIVDESSVRIVAGGFRPLRPFRRPFSARPEAHLHTAN